MANDNRRTALIAGIGASLVLLIAVAADVGGSRLTGSVALNTDRFASAAPASGAAVHADVTDGPGIFGDSNSSQGVWGSSSSSWGGYFTSVNGHGIRVHTDGGDHYDHGAYVTATEGYGVYAQSSNNMGVRGEAGDISGASVPLGRVGVAGIGQNRGVHGSSSNGLGVYGTTVSSTGVYGNTSRMDQNYGLYTNDNLFSQNFNLTGSIMQVVQNAGSEPLEKGDVVVFAGVKRPGVPDDLRADEPDDPQAKVAAELDVPMIRVAKATMAGGPAVAGVVFSRYNLAALGKSENEGNSESTGSGEVLGAGNEQGPVEVTPAGPAKRGDYLLLVVQGAAEVKADYAAGGIAPGTPLAIGFDAGRVARAADIVSEGASPPPGSILGKALETPQPGLETIYAYIDLQ